VDTYDGSNGSPDYGMIQESNEANNISDAVSVSVSGASATGQEAPSLPGSGRAMRCIEVTDDARGLTISWFWPIILAGLKHKLKEALLWPKFSFRLTN
jgi:hypothetical protein